MKEHYISDDEFLKQRKNALYDRLENITKFYEDNGLSVEDCKKALLQEIQKEEEYIEELGKLAEE